MADNNKIKILNGSAILKVISQTGVENSGQLAFYMFASNNSIYL